MSTIFRVFALAAAALVLPASVRSAALQGPQVEAGFTSLFNGKDFTGWRLANAGSFRIENGAIVANGPAGHAYYDGPFRDHLFKDFELRIDVMTEPGSNGGIYILTEFQEKGFPAKGFEVQVNNSGADRVKTGSLYHVLDTGAPLAKDKEWFTETIVVKGMNVTVNVNDKQAINWTQPAGWDGSFRALGVHEFAGRRIGTPGTIALQAHDPKSVVLYRNIRIKPLD
jgi:hypothetical protein